MGKNYLKWGFTYVIAAGCIGTRFMIKLQYYAIMALTCICFYDIIYLYVLTIRV